MRVAEIIADSIWLPGGAWLATQNQTATKPEISVILPTFCRHAEGFFERAVNAVLNQTLINLELIIVDDASSDGTFECIGRLMARDPRISCIRHPKNIGLPAVSEYEAFVKSSGKYIAFAFDDDEFLPESLQKIIAHAERLNAFILHGHVDIHSTDVITDAPFVITHFGFNAKTQVHLSSHNFFANSAVVLRRELIETIGFYDPNIAMTRLCDWDLWRRAAEQYRIHSVDVAMGKVSGPARKESLGRTYSTEVYLSHEWAHTARNERLRPANFHQIDVQHIPDDLSTTSRMTLIELQQNFTKKFWYRPQSTLIQSKLAATQDLADGYILVVVASIDASVILHFEHLQTRFRQRLRVIDAHVFLGPLLEDIAGASAVIFVRLIYAFQEALDTAKKLGVPHYYMSDDNFSELAKTPEFAEILGAYSVENMRHTLRSFSGVLLATPTLMDYFAENAMHESLYLFPPIAKQPELASLQHIRAGQAVSTRFTVLFFGGGHRQNAFKNQVLPALFRLAEVVSLRLIVVGADIAHLMGNSVAIELITKPLDLCYDLVLGELKHYRIDALMHPGDANPNNKFKNLNVLINAHILGAVPVLSNIAPFTDLKNGELAHLADSEDDWYRYLLQVSNHGRVQANATDTESNAKLLDRLAQFIKGTYNGAHNEAAITTILQRSPSAGIAARDQRSRLAIYHLRRQLADALAPRAAQVIATAASVQSTSAYSTNAPAGAQTQALAQVHTKRLTFGPLSKVGARVSIYTARYFVRPILSRHSMRAPFPKMPDAWQPIITQAQASLLQQGAASRIYPSRNVNGVPFREFEFSAGDALLGAITLPVFFTTPGVGEIGIELVDARDVIASNTVKNILPGAQHQVVRFEFSAIDLNNRSPWRFRIFCRGAVGEVMVPVCRVGSFARPGWAVLALREFLD